jgi:hypothetical protein
VSLGESPSVRVAPSGRSPSLLEEVEEFLAAVLLPGQDSESQAGSGSPSSLTVSNKLALCQLRSGLGEMGESPLRNATDGRESRSAEYKREMVKVVVRRAAEEALKMAESSL